MQRHHGPQWASLKRLPWPLRLSIEEAAPALFEAEASTTAGEQSQAAQRSPAVEPFPRGKEVSLWAAAAIPPPAVLPAAVLPPSIPRADLLRAARFTGVEHMSGAVRFTAAGLLREGVIPGRVA